MNIQLEHLCIYPMSECSLSFNFVPCIVFKDEILLRYEYLENRIMSCHGNYAFSQSPNRFIFMTTIFLIWHA